MTNNDTTNELRRLLDVYDDTSVSLDLCEQFAETVRELLNQTVTVHVTEEPAVGVKLVDAHGHTWDHDTAYFGGRWVIAKNLKRAKRLHAENGYLNPTGQSGGVSFDRLVEQYGPLTLKES